MKKLIPFLLLGMSAAAVAATLNLSWTNPAQNTDDSAIPATGTGSIVSTRIEVGSCSGTAFGTKSSEFTVTGQAQTTVTPDLPPGTYCLRAFSKNTYGSESGPSNVAQKVIVAPTPKPPTGFTVG